MTNMDLSSVANRYVLEVIDDLIDDQVGLGELLSMLGMGDVDDSTFDDLCTQLGEEIKKIRDRLR